MIWTLKRELDNGEGIRGSLFDEAGAFVCYTMEPSLRRLEHPGILPGTYQLAWTKSNRLGRETIELVNVPAGPKPRKPIWSYPQDWRHGIRIHPLNKPEESLGCIGLGMGRSSGMFISSSRKAVSMVENRLKAVMGQGIPVRLSILPAP